MRTRIRGFIFLAFLFSFTLFLFSCGGDGGDDGGGGVICGNGACESGEDINNCPQDCDYCGNGYCGPNENASTCPADCGSGAVCGNGACESGEDINNCPQDCDYCGNGYCGPYENSSTCPADCPPEPAQKISAGNVHTCALLSSGAVKCWGYNRYGQLGDGSTVDSNVPVDVVEISNAISISAGLRHHACAVLSSGAAKCWGDNDDGQLGDGSNNYRKFPVYVSGLINAISISAGWEHTCAVLSSGAAKCWGKNQCGQLGNMDYNRSFEPVDVVGINDAISIDTGLFHTCALLSSGAVKCWGDNSHSQLGDGSTIYESNVPVDVVGISDAISISVGGYHSCAVLSSGAVKCWGDNGYGQLGDGSNTDSNVPVDVVGISDAISISAGWEHTCAVLSSGAVKCWGDNGYGQLGDGSNTDSAVPVDVVGIGP